MGISIKSEFKKINVIGTSGTGKSTFSKRLAQTLDYPYIEMDQVFWEPNWKWSTDEKFFSNLEKVLVQDMWVLDGNYTRSIPIKWKNVDTIIWLDYSFPITLFQAIRRAVIRSITREELWEGTGNRESVRKSFFSKESIIWWTITTYSKVKKKYQDYMADPKYAHIKFIRLQSHKEADLFLKSLRSPN